MVATEVPLSFAIAISAFIAVFFFSWIQFRNHLNSMDTRLNTENLTPADYTLMLTGVPTNNLTEAEFRTDFEAQVGAALRSRTSVPVRVAKVVFTYDLTPFTEKVEQLRKLRKEKAAIDQYRSAYRRMVEKSGENASNTSLDSILPESCIDPRFRNNL